MPELSHLLLLQPHSQYTDLWSASLVPNLFKVFISTLNNPSLGACFGISLQNTECYSISLRDFNCSIN